jgi:hypothetical protein
MCVCFHHKVPGKGQEIGLLNFNTVFTRSAKMCVHFSLDTPVQGRYFIHLNSLIQSVNEKYLVPFVWGQNKT